MNFATSFTIAHLSIATGGRSGAHRSSVTPLGIGWDSLCAVPSNATAYGSGWHLPQTCEPSARFHQDVWARWI
jgi:hypothetical protein